MTLVDHLLVVLSVLLRQMSYMVARLAIQLALVDYVVVSVLVLAVVAMLEVDRRQRSDSRALCQLGSLRPLSRIRIGSPHLNIVSLLAF